MYRLFIKPLLFLISPEKAHYFTVAMLKLTLALPIIGYFFRKRYEVANANLQRNTMGLTFKNPVGLAAGFDKDGKSFEAMSALGFGFVEVGTVTPRPQSGNDLPRLFRLPADEALINRMGFNNDGVDALVTRLKNRPKSDVIIGGNIGKNKTTPNEQAHEDYLICFEKLFPYVDYFVVNVSSPNTPNLRALQDKAPLMQLLTLLQNENLKKATPKPILLKIAPDLNDAQLVDIVDIIHQTNLTGVVATNTTISRSDLNTPASTIETIGMGGLSGVPVKARATEIVRYLRKNLAKEKIIIGVGGISSAEDALEKLNAGADLVQIYTALVYAGPSLVKEINKKLETL
jgi:dihydroorotate dehydrogenase